MRLPREIKGYWPRFIATALADDLGPVLLFAPRRSNAEKLARQLSQQLPNQDPLVLTDEQKRLVGDHMTRMLQSRVAYHHSGLSYAARAGVIEPLAKAGQLRVVVATMGLAAGINFSLRSCALAADSYKRAGVEHPIGGDEILQMFGRAGRRGLDEVGYVLVGANDVRLRDAFPCQLARSGLVDWGALFGIMHAAVEDGREPFAEAIRVQSRLFTTRPITLGWKMHWNIRMLPAVYPPTPSGPSMCENRTRRYSTAAVNGNASRAARKCYCATSALRMPTA